MASPWTGCQKQPGPFGVMVEAATPSTMIVMPMVKVYLTAERQHTLGGDDSCTFQSQTVRTGSFSFLIALQFIFK